MRGSRVKNIVRELNNEKVDIIRWSSDPKEFVLEALKPAKVKNLVFDLGEEERARFRSTKISFRSRSGKRARTRA